MSIIVNFINTKVLPKILVFVNSKGIIAVKDGMLSILPLTVVGSFFLVIGQIPSKDINNFIANIFGEHWTEPFMQVYGGTFAIMGLISCFAIAYAYVKNEGFEPLPAGVLAVSAFFITSNSYVVAPISSEIIDNTVSKAWIGGQGMISAIIIGLVVGYIYSLFLRRNIVIKMPKAVPKTVAVQFTAFLPAACIFTCALITYALFKAFGQTTLLEAIYSLVQVPLQGLTDSLGGMIAIAFFISFLWWFGVHGQSIVNGIVTSILTANAIDNTKILAEKGYLDLSNGGHIVTQQFLDSFILLTGSGITFGIVFAMIVAAKSKQYKFLGKAVIFPTLFNINEPITFGFGIVLNPIMFIPFIVVPILSGLLVYFAFVIGFLEPFSGVMLPWSTPGILSGFLVAGWKGALLQAIILVISIVGYYPFFKKMDAIAYAKEQQEALTTNS